MPQELFRTTRWSMVLAASSAAPESSRARAMGELCQAYWYPLYAYARRHGLGPDDAEDLVQGFFIRFLEKDRLSGLSPEKGKFRAFLLVCFKRFIANWHEHARAVKRGGGRSVVSIDREDAEGRYRCEPQHQVTPEKAFERQWALTVLERALSAVAADYEARGKSGVFAALKVYLTGDSGAPNFAETGKALGISESAAKVAAHRLRQRYRLAVEKEIADTLSSEVDLELEIASLLKAVSNDGG